MVGIDGTSRRLHINDVIRVLRCLVVETAVGMRLVGRCLGVVVWNYVLFRGAFEISALMSSVVAVEAIGSVGCQT